MVAALVLGLASEVVIGVFSLVPLLSGSFKGKPSLLLRRFVFRMAEASAKRVTGDEPQGTMGRVQTAGEATSRPLSPSRLPLRAHFHRKRDVWVRDRGKPLISHAQGAYFKGKKKQPWVCYLCAFPTRLYKNSLSFYR